MTTKIEWATETWNPITGCSKISTGCKNCYAERMAKRLAGRYGYPSDDPFRVTFHHDRLHQPCKWKKPRMVFVCSMSDIFHEGINDDQIDSIFSMMTNSMSGASHHTYLILTKRPERILKGSYDRFAEWKNIWLGVTAENQEQADRRIPILLQIPAAVRFVSVEPMLGPVVLRRKAIDAREIVQMTMMGRLDGYSRPVERGIDWIICGGESGPGARPMHPEWPRGLRDQCVDAGVPFFFKQWGQWEPVCQLYADDQADKEDGRGELFALEPNGHIEEHYQPSPNAWLMESVGKKRAGRILDGRTWDQYPKKR